VATRVYAVAWDAEGRVDEAGTGWLRAQRLRARLAAARMPGDGPPCLAGGADPRAVGGDLGVLLDDGRPMEWVSLSGRARLGPVTADYRAACAVLETPVNALGSEFAARPGRPGAAMLLREYLCPVSGLRLATEIIRSGDEPAADMVLAGGPT
jgi:N-methylhydantoinase B